MSPIYRVRCDRCRHEEDATYRAVAAAEPLREHGLPCPVAGCGGTMRVIPAPCAFTLKGGGWSKTYAGGKD